MECGPRRAADLQPSLLLWCVSCPHGPSRFSWLHHPRPPPTELTSILDFVLIVPFYAVMFRARIWVPGQHVVQLCLTCHGQSLAVLLGRFASFTHLVLLGPSKLM